MWSVCIKRIYTKNFLFSPSFSYIFQRHKLMTKKLFFLFNFTIMNSEFLIIVYSVFLPPYLKLLLWHPSFKRIDNIYNYKSSVLCKKCAQLGVSSAHNRFLHKTVKTVKPWRCGCLATWFCYQLIAKPGNKTATPLWVDPLLLWHSSFKHIENIYYYKYMGQAMKGWLSYYLVLLSLTQLAAKPGNKTATPSWPDALL